MTKEEKDGRIKLWSEEGKRSDDKRNEGQKIKVVECRGEEE
jgi:hypothetical protein